LSAKALQVFVIDSETAQHCAQRLRKSDIQQISIEIASPKTIPVRNDTWLDERSFGSL
jgi:hypothetical protein